MAATSCWQLTSDCCVLENIFFQKKLWWQNMILCCVVVNFFCLCHPLFLLFLNLASEMSCGKTMMTGRFLFCDNIFHNRLRIWSISVFWSRFYRLQPGDLFVHLNFALRWSWSHSIFKPYFVGINSKIDSCIWFRFVWRDFLIVFLMQLFCFSYLSHL